MLKYLSFIACCLIAVSMSSCGSLKQLQYLQGPIDTVAVRDIKFVEPIIQQGDLLSVMVYSDNQNASAVYNQGGTVSSSLVTAGAGGVATSTMPPGYLVNRQGNIQMFQLGAVPVEGKTKKQLADSLAAMFVAKNALQNPYVEVRFLNFKVTVLGDVAQPGAKTFATDKVSIFDALGQAGDLTSYAKRDNVLVVRESKGIREFARLNLTDPMVFNSPFFYLQQNDMVIVDPTKTKATLNDQTYRNVSIATSIISVVAIFFTIFRKN